MRPDAEILSLIARVFWLFASLSLLAVGGGSAIIPELQRQSVQELGWLTQRQFVDFYALTQITPGPSMMVVALVGFQAAGLPGALAAAAGMFGPTSLLAVSLRSSWNRLRQSRWKNLMEDTTRPLAVATMLASATLVARATNTRASDWIISLLATALVASKRLGILPTMILSGLLGCLAGWLPR